MHVDVSAKNAHAVNQIIILISPGFYLDDVIKDGARFLNFLWAETIFNKC